MYICLHHPLWGGLVGNHIYLLVHTGKGVDDKVR